MKRTSGYWVVAFLVVGSGLAAADPTTLGLEWEMSQQGVDLTVLAERSTGRGAIVYRDAFRTDAERAAKTAPMVQPRLLCTTAMSGSGFPLMSLTFDLPGTSARTVHQLELVSGPLLADPSDPGWASALQFTQTLYDVVGEHCSVAAPEGEYCNIPLGLIATEMNKRNPGSVTTRCYGSDASRNLRLGADRLNEIALKIRATSFQVPTLSGMLARGVERASVQASLGLDLENLTTKPMDSLFGNKESFGYKAFRYFLTAKLPTFAALSPDAQAAAALYFVQFHVLLRQLLLRDRWPEVPVGTEVSAFKTRFLEEGIGFADWRMKNDFNLLAKTPLNEIVRAFPAGTFDPVLAQRDDFYCDEAFLRADSFENDTEGERFGMDVCKDLYDTYWKTEFLAGRDPLRLTVLSNTVPLVETKDKKLRVVFEMRSRTDLVGSRHMTAAISPPAAPGAKPGRLITLAWAPTAMTLPAGLPTR